MSTAMLIFTPDGLVHGLYTERIDLSGIGRLTVKRAVSIEFDNDRQVWCARDPSGVPQFTAPSRQQCLDWEEEYLNHQLETQE